MTPGAQGTAQAAVAIASRHTPRSRSSSANSRRDHDRRPSTYCRIASLACAADTVADIAAGAGAVTGPSAGTDIRRAGTPTGTETAAGTATATGTGTGRGTGADTHAAAAAEEHELTMDQGYAGGLTTRPATARRRPGTRP